MTRPRTQKAPFTQTMDFVIDQGTATDQHQGNLKVTHNTFDMGINGPGYFQPPDWPWDTSPDQFTSAERIAMVRGRSVIRCRICRKSPHAASRPA